jgi:hypothetical protein
VGRKGALMHLPEPDYRAASIRMNGCASDGVGLSSVVVSRFLGRERGVAGSPGIDLRQTSMAAGALLGLEKGHRSSNAIVGAARMDLPKRGARCDWLRGEGRHQCAIVVGI